MLIIAILAALILGASGYVLKKGALARTEAGVRAIGAALEAYRSDNVIYPRNTDTDALDARLSGNPSAYQAASLFLYKSLSGDSDGNRVSETKGYYSFPINMLFPKESASNVLYIQDPFGFSFGYSTAAAKALEAGTGATAGYNPNYDLWSTAGKATAPSPGNATDVTLQWIKNW